MKTKFIFISLLCVGILSCENYLQGAEKGSFSVSETKKVVFSQGNLQYQASTDTWRFAEHQYDIVGIGYRLTDEGQDCYVGGTVSNSDNKLISSAYGGWIDLFGWGTGNNPTNISNDKTDYQIFAEWGVNKISNGGNVANAWRTLTASEWYYLLFIRKKASVKQGVACVNGINGLVLLPDNWTLPSGIHFTSGFAKDSGSAYYKTVNTYTVSEWQVMDNAGAVFLPAVGYRKGANVSGVGYYGGYWSSTEDGKSYANGMDFLSDEVSMLGGYNRYYGFSVRLCSEL